MDNARLDVGQGFRSWYEYGKFAAERLVREDRDLPSRIVRFGPVLGVTDQGPPSMEEGVLAVVPSLLRGYPAHLRHHGRFRCYVSEVHAAARVLARALTAPDEDGLCWTYYDDRRQTLAEVLVALCAPWGVVPRIVDLRFVGRASRLLAGPLGIPEALLAYAEPWVDVDDAVLAQMPEDVARCPDGYVEETGAALRAGQRLALTA
jgi:hypothetical protein